jgi:hypothetical protein
MKTKKVICATIIRKRPHRPKNYYFDTMDQGEVENELLKLGYGGGTDYYLDYVHVQVEKY